MIERLEQAGLGYRVQARHTKDKLGESSEQVRFDCILLSTYMFVILSSFGFDTFTSYIYISLTTLTLLNAEINSLTKYPCILTELFYCVWRFHLQHRHT